MEYIRERYNGNLKWLADHTFYIAKAGSQAYGLDTPESDVDVRGICIPPREYYLGFMQNFEQAIWSEPDDATIFGINKFFKLAADANPNVIEILFVDEEDVIESNELGEVMRHYRDAFLSKKAKFTFSWYAHSQLKRIQTHRRWLLNPPEKKPERRDFGIDDQAILDAGVRGAIDKLTDKGYKVSTEVMEMFKRERNYAQAMHEYHLYEGWKKARNPVRAALEAEFGYDCKHASHLVRLLRMGKEILEGRGVIVKRKEDGDELRAIKQGSWPFEKLIEYAEEAEAELDDMYEKSTLRHTPDRKFLDELLVYLVEESLSHHFWEDINKSNGKELITIQDGGSLRGLPS